jgi:hypothetical protein
MTVAELIEQLQEMRQDANVYVRTRGFDDWPVTGVGRYRSSVEVGDDVLLSTDVQRTDEGQ